MDSGRSVCWVQFSADNILKYFSSFSLKTRFDQIRPENGKGNGISSPQSVVRAPVMTITKTCLFKYIEDFTSKS